VDGHLKRPPYFLRTEMKLDQAARSALLTLTSPKAISVQGGAVPTQRED